MKLWMKLSLVMVVTLMAATGVSGAAVIYRTEQYNEEKTLEIYGQQLKSTAYAIAKELQDSPIEEYSERTRYSFFNYLVKKYDPSKYILLEGNQAVCNLTPFEFTGAKDGKWKTEEGNSAIQKNGKQYILVAGRQIPYNKSKNYSLILVQDISPIYEDIRQQAYLYMVIYAGAALFSVLLVFILSKRILKPLKELQQAAEGISRGDLKRRVWVRTRDEAGVLAEAFNGMAERIEGQMTELEYVSEQRRQMLGSLTHELKTPMTSIIGYADTLLHVNLKKENQERALAHIHEECRRLERLSGKLMNLMGMYDNDSVYMEEVSVQELFRKVEDLEKYHLDEKKIVLKISCEMNSLWADKDLMESLLINLIDNAVKASGEGGSILLEGYGKTISVQDYGIGIPDEEVEKVTEAFYMVDKARSRKSGGSGLGLALCSRIAALHGAELRIQSKLGEGTKVAVVFQSK